MKVTLLDYTQDAEYKIGLYAAECYDSNTERDACIRRAKICLTSGHLATASFAYATFRVDGISRVCSHQFVRHAHLRYLQRSQRYCFDNELWFVTPPALLNLPDVDIEAWGSLLEEASDLYTRLVSEGKMKKEDARFILPQSCVTSVTVTGNLQAWMNFLKLRADKHAQWEIRAVAEQVGKQLAESVAPGLFAEYAA